MPVNVRVARPVAVLAAVCGVLLAVPAASATATPACASVVEAAHHNPGGNGKKYESIPSGVYGWTIVPPYGYRVLLPDGHIAVYTGIIYAGSGNLKNRRSYWKRFWKSGISAGDKFVWHVLTRDWDTRNKALPDGLTLKEVRLGAEQIAISDWKAWGEKHNYFLWNKINAVAARNPRRKKMEQAGTTLMKDQLENNAPSGDGPAAGDELNVGDELPDTAVGELPGGGAGKERCPP